ncbi:MAG TPA: hypothetical protein PKD61_34215, partial [Polyangiaceae bacterium]|nr:hypothetical protein [Polyangiaceae bacterium]
MSKQLDPVAVHGPVVQSPWAALRSRPAWAAVGLSALALLAEVVPALEPLRVLGAATATESQPAGVAPPVLTTGEATLKQETTERPELAQPEHVQIPT